MLFANKIVKHSKSIHSSRGKQTDDCQWVGQTSRVDALRHSIEKAGSFNFDLKGAVMASDAFFPLPTLLRSLTKRVSLQLFNQVGQQ